MITFSLDDPFSVVLARFLRSGGQSVEARSPAVGAANTPFSWYTRRFFTCDPYSSLGTAGFPLSGRTCLVCCTQL